MFHKIALFLVLYVTHVQAEYECLCNSNNTRSVHAQPFEFSSVVGTLIANECKPTFPIGSYAQWRTIQFHAQVGYVRVTQDIRLKTCSGSLPNRDAVRTPSPLIVATTGKTPVSAFPKSTITPSSSSTLKSTPSTAMKTTEETSTPMTQTTTSETRATTKISETTSPTTPETTRTSRKTSSTTQTTLQSTRTTKMTTTRKTSTMTQTRTSTTTSTALPSMHGNIQRCPKSVTQRTNPMYVYQYGKFCYEYSTKMGTWYDAKSDCSSRGGVLLSIENEDQQRFIQGMVYNVHDYFPVWLGLYDAAQEESWKWLSGAPLTYTNWMPGRYEDDFHDSQDCGMFVTRRHGQWDDIVCTGTLFSEPAKHRWICQYNTTTSGSG